MFADIRNQEEDMLALCAATNRGQSADAAQRSRMASLITGLENDFKTAVDVDGLLPGTWLLVYSSEVWLVETTHLQLFCVRFGNPLHAACGTFHCWGLGSNRFKLAFFSQNPTRSSPFFWAFKGLCEGITQPLPGLPASLSDALFTITDGIPFAQVGLARHTITEIDEEKLTLKSEVQVTLSVMDAFLPPSTGFITSTAELRRLSQSQHEVTVLTTAVKKSTWASLPLLSFVDDYDFPSKDVMESMKDGSSAAVLETTYVSDRLRISCVRGMTLVHVRDNSVL